MKLPMCPKWVSLMCYILVFRKLHSKHGIPTNEAPCWRPENLQKFQSQKPHFSSLKKKQKKGLFCCCLQKFAKRGKKSWVLWTSSCFGLQRRASVAGWPNRSTKRGISAMIWSSNEEWGKKRGDLETSKNKRVENIGKTKQLSHTLLLFAAWSFIFLLVCNEVLVLFENGQLVERTQRTQQEILPSHNSAKEAFFPKVTQLPKPNSHRCSSCCLLRNGGSIWQRFCLTNLTSNEGSWRMFQICNSLEILSDLYVHHTFYFESSPLTLHATPGCKSVVSDPVPLQ